MLEGMEYIKYCGNCEKFVGRYNECSRRDIGSRHVQHPEFYYCDEFEKQNEKSIPPVKPPKKSVDDKDKLIYNMAKYIVELDIDCDICVPTVRNGGCLIEKEYSSDVDCAFNKCIECIKKWFSEDR